MTVMFAPSIGSWNSPLGVSSPGGTVCGISFHEAFHLATMGGAEVLGLDGVIGNFQPGKQVSDGSSCIDGSS